MVDLNFEGMDQLLTNLQHLGENVSKVENAALRAGGEVIQGGISRRAPRSMSGKIHAADHIVISKVKLKDGVKFVLVGPDKGDNSEFFYLKFFEWGTSKMPARPFMAPTIAEDRKLAIEAMADVVKGGLKL